MEAVRNCPGLKNRAIAGPAGRTEQAARQEFLYGLQRRLADVPFVAGDEFSVADITAVVTVDFATKAAGLPIATEHAALKRWYDAVSTRASMAA
jgi:glutathione S-transferase